MRKGTRYGYAKIPRHTGSMAASDARHIILPCYWQISDGRKKRITLALHEPNQQADNTEASGGFVLFVPPGSSGPQRPPSNHHTRLKSGGPRATPARTRRCLSLLNISPSIPPICCWPRPASHGAVSDRPGLSASSLLHLAVVLILGALPLLIVRSAIITIALQKLGTSF